MHVCCTTAMKWASAQELTVFAPLLIVRASFFLEMRRVGSARPCVPRVAIAPRLHPPRSLPLSCRPARFTSSSSSPLLEPELVRPISPGFRLRKARDIPVRQVTPQGAQEITAARLALRERESKGLPVQYTDLAALLERASRANDLTAAKEILADINLRRFKHTSPRALCSLMQVRVSPFASRVYVCVASPELLDPL